MRKLSVLFTLCAALLLGCGEAGFEVDISKENEVDIILTNADFENGSFSKNESINLAEGEFDKYLDDIEKYEVNKISIQVLGYENTDPNAKPTFLEFQVQKIGTSMFDVFLPSDIINFEEMDLKNNGITDANGRIKEGDKILIYDKDDNDNSLIDSSNKGLQDILFTLENRSALNVYANLYMDGQFDGELKVRVFFDVTARTQQD